MNINIIYNEENLSKKNSIKKDIIKNIINKENYIVENNQELKEEYPEIAFPTFVDLEIVFFDRKNKNLNNVFSQHAIKDEKENYNEKHQVYININNFFYKEKLESEKIKNNGIKDNKIEEEFYKQTISNITQSITEAIYFISNSSGISPYLINKLFIEKDIDYDILNFETGFGLSNNSEYFFNLDSYKESHIKKISKKRINRMNYEKFNKSFKIDKNLQKKLFNEIKDNRINKLKP